MLDLSQFRGYRAADALTRAAPVGRTEFASLTVLFPCSNFVSSLRSEDPVSPDLLFLAGFIGLHLLGAGAFCTIETY